MANRPQSAVTTEIKDIMEKIMRAFPNEYQKFDVDGIFTVFTLDKKSKKNIYKLKSCKYPESLLHDRVYTLEIFNENWKSLDDNQKAHLTSRIMMSIPDDGFTSDSDDYGKLIKPDYEMYSKEYKLTKGNPNWIEDSSNLPDLFAQGTLITTSKE